MKHLKLFFALFAMLALGIGNAWGAEYELIATLDCAKASSEGTSALYGSSTSSMSADKVKAYINAAAGKTLISSDPTISGSIYWSKGNGGGDIPNNVFKLGKASGPGSVKFTIDGTDNVVKVVIVGHGWKTSSSISVNSADAQQPSAQYTEQTFVFDNLSPTKDITISVTSSAVCITSIQLYKEASGGGETPDPTPSKLSTPANLKEASIAETSATLSWDAVANASNYSVTINGNTETVTTNSYSATGLTAGTEYTWSVVAKGDDTNYTDSDAAQHTFTTTAATTPDPEPGTGTNVTYDFTKIDGFENWPTAYASGKGDVVYTEATVKFTGAVKQSQTITDCPVTKGGEVQLVLNSGYSDRDITNVTFVCRQWGSKTQTITLHYSTDGGVNYANTEITSTNFTISSDNLPEGTNAVKITFSSSSNQVGIESVTFSLSSDDEPGTEEPVLSVEPEEVAFGTKNIYFDSEKQGSLEIEITGQNLTGNVTATITEDDDNVFSLSSSSFAPNAGEVSEKLTVSYEVSEEKEYSATLTLSSAGVEAIELPITLTTVNKKPTVYTKVTDAATLSAGDKVIFVYETGKVAAGAISNTSGGYLASIDITQALNTTANPATVSITDEAVVEYTLGGTAGAWELISAGNKLSEKTANSSSSVDLIADGDTKWSITISDGDATIKGTTNTIKYNTTSPRFKTYNSGQTAIQLYAISVPKYAVNFTQPEGGELLVKNGETAITSGNTFAEGIKLTVTATPANGYEGGTVVVEDADGNDVTTTVYADGVLTMPAYAVTISATFDEKPCELLVTPTVSAETTYNSATLTWDAVANAAKYSVKIGTAEAVETEETSYEVTGLTAETEYTYQVQAIAEVDQDTYCDSEVAEGTFTTATAPTATLTLSDIEGTTTKTGALNGTITLPTEAAECSKTFVGWDSKSDCAVAPEYAPGAEYTFTTLDPTLYAVYADGEGGGTVTITPSAVDNDAENDIHTFTIDAAGYSLTAKKNSGSSAPTINASAKDVRIYAKGTVTLTAPKALNTIVFNISTQGKKRLAPITASVGAIATQASGDATVTWTGDATEVTFTVGDNANYGSEGATKAGQLCFGTITVTTAGSYSNYSTTCAAAPIATVNPTSVTATAAGVEGKVTVTYENVNTENVAVALFNDEACTETFTAGWLTASLDGDKHITYTVAATTLYTERKAYIKLTAPETNDATDPDVVVIPLTQAGKDKVFASLAELVAADLTAGDEVTVTLNNDVIKDFYIYSSKRCGVVFDVQKDGKDIKIYFNNQTTIVDWAVGGKLSGTLTNVKWTTYSSAWQLVPDYNTWAWANLTYTEPKAVSTVVVSGAPTKTTYVDGEAFDPAGVTVTVNYNDATSEVNPTGVTFEVTPATLTKGETSVSVTATYNTVSSAPYEVTGLTVNDIPTKTVAEFIEAGGTRCYLEGIVSNITNTTYGNFDLTDASGTIYVYGCLNGAGESQKFADLGVKNGDKIKVIADEYELYGGTKDEAIDVQYVSHISAATITIADITMEVEEVKTIPATVEPVEAEVTYIIKENAANAISLSGNIITALAEGTATITAIVAEGATYLGNSVDFTVTVGPKSVSDEVVILAELDGKWYAMKGAAGSGTGQLAALEVTYFNGILYNVAEADKASITWTRTIVDGKATFVNNGNYLKGKDGDLSLVTTADNNCEWTSESGFYTTGNNRTFIYRNNYNFKNYSVQNVGKSGYSGFPEVVVPAYATGDVVYTRTVTNGNYGTICIPYASSSYSGAKFYEVSWLKTDAGLYLDELAEGDALEAGKPYIFLATNTEITVTCTGAAVADPVAGVHGLTGTFTDIAAGGVQGDYIIAQNQIWIANESNWVNAYRAYIKAEELPTTEQAQLPGRRRVCMGENVETGVEDIITTDAPVKVIENGQLIIIRDGVKYNVQGQKL